MGGNEGYFDMPSENSIVEEDRSSVKDKDKNVSINLNKNFQDIMVLQQQVMD
jgi:hypothetical protein